MSAGISAEAIDAMVGAGATVEVLAALWKAEIAKNEKLAEERRSKDRDRQRRHRESRAVTVTRRAPPNEYISNPPVPPVEDKSSTAPKGAKRRAKVVSVQVPEWMPSEPWLAMVAMRERMHPKVQWSEDAAKGIISKISRLRDAGHCPTKLLEKAVVSSWRTVFEAEDTLATTPRLDLTEEERRTRQLGLADLYDKMGRTDEATDIRRRWATGPPGQSVGDVVKRMNIGG